MQNPIFFRPRRRILPPPTIHARMGLAHAIEGFVILSSRSSGRTLPQFQLQAPVLGAQLGGDAEAVTNFFFFPVPGPVTHPSPADFIPLGQSTCQSSPASRPRNPTSGVHNWDTNSHLTLLLWIPRALVQAIDGCEILSFHSHAPRPRDGEQTGRSSSGSAPIPETGRTRPLPASGRPRLLSRRHRQARASHRCLEAVANTQWPSPVKAGAEAPFCRNRGRLGTACP